MSMTRTGQEDSAASNFTTSSSRTTSLASNPVTLFSSPSSVETKQSHHDILSPTLAGLVGDVINSFLGFKDKVNLFQLNQDLKKRLGANYALKQALIKELLLTLVNVWQKFPLLSLPQAESLLGGTLKLTESHPVEQQLAHVATTGHMEVKVALDVAFNHAIQAPGKLALTKKILLELIRAHQYSKAKVLLDEFPPFLNRSEDQLDYLFALMVSGYQNEAEAWIRKYPDLVRQKGTVVDQDGIVYQGLTPYQYTLCLKHTQMRLMIRKSLATQETALQAKEFSTGENRDMNALTMKYSLLMERTMTAYQFFRKNYDSWTSQQRKEYWNRVIGGLQREWPVHWMQEMAYPGRDFDDETNFSSEEALKALPEAKYGDGDAIYPWNKGYTGTRLTYLPESIITRKELFKNQLCLSRVENDYFIYGPKLTNIIEAAVDWIEVKLDVTSLGNILESLCFTGEEQTIEYHPALTPLYAAVDKALGGRVAGTGFSFEFANAAHRRYGVAAEARGGWGRAQRNLEGLLKLNLMRFTELHTELTTAKLHLPKMKEEATAARRSPSPFR